MYDWEAMTCDFGGALGIVVGGCIFTLFQLIDYLLFEMPGWKRINLLPKRTVVIFINLDYKYCIMC